MAKKLGVVAFLLVAAMFVLVNYRLASRISKATDSSDKTSFREKLRPLFDRANLLNEASTPASLNLVRLQMDKQHLDLVEGSIEVDSSE